MNRYFGLHTLEGEWHSLLPRYLLLGERVAGRRILDIGCGSGIGSSLLLELGATMVDAIDHRPAVLELARMKHAKPGLDFHVMFWEELNFEDDTFDLVLCLDPSSPVTDPSLLQEVRRVLKPAGQYVCAIERKTLEGLETLLPRYGYADAAESIDLHVASERPPQVGELQSTFASTAVVEQRPVVSFRFGAAADDTPAVVDDRLSRRDDDEAAVQLWFCSDEELVAPAAHEIRLPYYSLVDRLSQVINDLQMRQVRRQEEGQPFFDEILDDGPSEVFERERQPTNEYRTISRVDDAPTRTRLPAIRDDLGDQTATLHRVAPVAAEPVYGADYRDGLEAQLQELAALYQQVRHEFQSVVRDAQQALEERDRYIEHLVGTVQRWQHRFEPGEGDEQIVESPGAAPQGTDGTTSDSEPPEAEDPSRDTTDQPVPDPAAAEEE